MSWAGPALEKWLATGGNIRVQHNPSLYPAGVGVEVAVKSDGVYVTAEIVEPNAVRLIEKGVLRAFSIGVIEPKVVRDRIAKGGRIVGGDVCELSVVDRPANPECAFSLAKSIGAEIMSPQEFTIGSFQEAENSENGSEAERTETAATRTQEFAERPDTVKSPPRSGGESEAHESLTKAVGDTVSEGREGDFPEGTKFAYIDSEGGKHLPIHDAKHVRLALGRFNQTNFETAADKKKAAKEILSAAKKFDIEVDDDSDVAQTAKKSATPELVLLHDMLCPAIDFTEFKSENPKLVKNGIAATLGPSSRQALFTMLDNEVDEDGGSGQEAYDIECIAKAYSELCSFITSELIQSATDEGMYLSVRAELAKDRQFYTNAHKDDLRAKLGQLHSILATVFPDICSDEQGDLARAEQTENDAALDEARVSEEDKTVDSVVAKESNMSDGKDDSDDDDDEGNDDTSDGDEPSPEPPAPKDKKNKKSKKGKKSAKIELLKAEKAQLQKQVDKLGSQPDMSNAPSRAPAYAKDKKIAVDEVRKSEAAIAMSEKVAFLQSLARGGTGEQQTAAKAELVKMGVPLKY